MGGRVHPRVLSSKRIGARSRASVRRGVKASQEWPTVDDFDFVRERLAGTPGPTAEECDLFKEVERLEELQESTTHLLHIAQENGRRLDEELRAATAHRESWKLIAQTNMHTNEAMRLRIKELRRSPRESSVDGESEWEPEVEL